MRFIKRWAWYPVKTLDVGWIWFKTYYYITNATHYYVYFEPHGRAKRVHSFDKFKHRMRIVEQENLFWGFPRTYYTLEPMSALEAALEEMRVNK